MLFYFSFVKCSIELIFFSTKNTTMITTVYDQEHQRYSIFWPKKSCHGMRPFHILCSICVYYLNLFSLFFVNETKALYDVILYVQLKPRQGISVNVFRETLNYLQSVTNLLHQRQSVVTCVTKGIYSKSSYWNSLIDLFTAQKVYRTVSCLLSVCCMLQAFSCSKLTQ